MRINQSFCWWCFENKGVDALPMMKAARKMGYAAIELIPPSMFDTALGEGLVIASYPGHPLQFRGLNDSTYHDEFESDIMRNLEVATKYKIPNLIVFSGERREGRTDQDGVERSAEGLRRVAKAAEDAGVNLVIELLNSRVDHAGYQCDKSVWAIAVVDLVGSPRVKALYDVYHMQIMEGDIIRTIRDHSSYWAHYHTGGNPGRNDLDETQELYYPPIMKAIKDSGYSGYVAHEFVPKGDPLKALEAAFKLCDV